MRLAALVIFTAPFAFALLAASGARADDDDDDELIIVEDEPFPTAAPAEGADAADDDSDDDDDIIIIEDEDDDVTPSPQTTPISGALGRLWETWHVAADSDLLGTVQLVEPEDGPWRLLGNVWLESWLLPAQHLSIYANGFGRVAIDGTPTGRLVPFSDVYEAYAKINVDRAVVTMGRIVVPWGRTQGAALGDRLNPPDHRRGPPFPDPARQKQPLVGGSVRGSLGSLGIEAVAFPQYDPTEGSLAAANQGGVRIARYQTALVRSPARAGGLLTEDDRSPLLEEPVLLDSASLGGRAWRRIGDLDVSGSVFWGFDEVPELHLRPDVAHALASELLSLRGTPVEVPLACSDPTLACVGERGALSHARTTSFSLDASWGLGIVIVRAEAVAYPNIGALGGKTAIIVDDLGLRSQRVSQYAAALAVEGSVGQYVDGSLELFDVAWVGVPANAVLWGVEAWGPTPSADERVVHRLAGAWTLAGSLFEERMRWRLRGEAGILQPDVLVSAELRYRLPILGLYVGGRADAFTGVQGSPGWFRQEGTLVGVFVGEGT